MLSNLLFCSNVRLGDVGGGSAEVKPSPVVSCGDSSSLRSLDTDPTVQKINSVGPQVAEQFLKNASPSQSGISLVDAMDSVFAGFAANNCTSGGNQDVTSGFSLVAYSPNAWLVNNSNLAKKRFETYVPTASDLKLVFRIAVLPDTPVCLTGDAASHGSSVDHIVIRSANKKVVLQPIVEKQCLDNVRNSVGGSVDYYGRIAYFDYVALTDFRNKNGEEFLITAIPVSNQESAKDFKVKKKNFKNLP